jgi:GntR family carbon starvation induced transcriptional regulator
MKITETLAEPDAATPTMLGAGTKSHRAYAQIRADILSCRLMPGTKLNIAGLASDLDVSLGAVREALSMLQSEALVVSEPQRGYTVSPVSPKELAEITEARIAIETLCLRTSIERGDLGWETSVVAAFHRLSRLSASVEGKDMHLSEPWSRAHAEFHASLLGACGNDWLLRMRAMLYEQSERYRRMSVPLDSGSRDVHGEHKALFDAVMARDTEAAAAALENHLRRTATIVRASVSL